MTQGPYQARAPWPTMRGDLSNSGRFKTGTKTSSKANLRHFRTKGPVFSTPVIGAGETIYVGSADHKFYALDPTTGKKLWSLKTKEIIDSAACIGRDGSLYVPAADGLYRLSPEGKILWQLDLLKTRERFTLSTIYWWEGNAVLGPNNLLYAGCDDFYFYAIEPATGEIKWASRTGCCVWTAAAFYEGMVYAASFDLHVYAFDQATGEIRWNTSLSNFIASSPAVAQDGACYIGAFDGQLYALDAITGEKKWSLKTGGSIYASPAITQNGDIIISSGDGNIYSVDTKKRSVRWTFFTGDNVRSSASLGPDPTGIEDYLIYCGGGNGSIYVLTPGGQRRWSYNTLIRGPKKSEHCNLNASIALGHNGFATASANGDIIYLPYDFYLTNPKDKAVCTKPGDGYPEKGVFLNVLSSGGLPKDLIKNQQTVKAKVGENVSLRLLHRENGKALPVQIKPKKVRINRLKLPYKCRVSPEKNQINLIPKNITRPGTYNLKLKLPYKAEGKDFEFKTRLKIKVEEPKDSLDSPPLNPLRINRISIYDPSVLPSFDQIAIASLAIDYKIVRYNKLNGRVLGWGVQKFGLDEAGESTVGIPVPRFFYFAFTGIFDQGVLALESQNILFEISAFPVPLKHICLTATCTKKGIKGNSLNIEAKMEGLTSFACKRLLMSGSEYSNFAWRKWKDITVPTFTEAVNSLRQSLRFAYKTVRSWFPKNPSVEDWLQLLHTAAQQISFAARMFANRAWHKWGLLHGDGLFYGVGTYQLSPSPLGSHKGLHLDSLKYHPGKRAVTANFRTDDSYKRTDAVPGILVYNRRTLKPLPISYSEWTLTERDDRGIPVKTTLHLPPSLSLKCGLLKAAAFIDLEERGEIMLGRLPKLKREHLMEFWRGVKRTFTIGY